MRNVLGGTIAAIVSATMLSHAQSPVIPASLNETASAWFVQLSSPPTANGTAAATLEQEEASFHAQAASAGVHYKETRHYRDLWNGLAVRASGRDIAKLRALPGVQSVFPVMKVRVADVEDPPGNAPELITALAQTGADIAQSELGLSGRGVRVAVIDTGIDYDHPDLGGCFGPGCRVEKGFDFVGDAFNADDLEPIIAPDPLPDDCAGHGTHVSGIIGANGGITGVAPGVKFHAYRVFGCEGTTTSDVMLAAMEMALHDGADVLNMSIGAAFQWPQYPTAQAADRLVKHGMAVVAAIGNDGALGLYGASAPGVGKDVIGVASFDNTHANLVAFTVSPDNTPVGYIVAEGAPPAPTSGTEPIVRTGTTTIADDACNPLAPGSLAGNVALIRRGTCSFYIKAANAQAAGATAVVLYNNAAGFVSPTVAGTPPITIPVVAITAAKGALIDGRIAAQATTITWTTQLASEPNPTANLISSFSSYGLAADLSFKPDLGAPGGTIRSTLPLEQGGYGALSGTSMASPHVAGAVALLLEALPQTQAAEVQQRLQNTAQPHNWWGNPALGFLDNVHRQGAGMLQIADAIEADAVVSPSSLALGEIESGDVVRTLTIRRPGQPGHHGRGANHSGDDAEVTYRLGYQPALATGADTFKPSFLASFASVQFSTPSVTLGGSHHNNDASIQVRITPPPVSDGARLFGGYITLTPSDASPVLRVPFAGYDGDYQAIQVLTLAGFPLLAELTADGFVPQPNGALFTMQGDDVPFILLHLNHQVANLKMEVIDVATGQSMDFADDEDFIGRNSAANSFFAFAWDGTTMKKAGGKLREVPNGTYRIELSVLKALGDPNNPAHSEHWSSPNITIARPITTH